MLLTGRRYLVKTLERNGITYDCIVMPDAFRCLLLSWQFWKAKTRALSQDSEEAQEAFAVVCEYADAHGYKLHNTTVYALDSIEPKVRE